METDKSRAPAPTRCVPSADGLRTLVARPPGYPVAAAFIRAVGAPTLAAYFHSGNDARRYTLPVCFDSQRAYAPDSPADTFTTCAHPGRRPRRSRTSTSCPFANGCWKATAWSLLPEVPPVRRAGWVPANSRDGSGGRRTYRRDPKPSPGTAGASWRQPCLARGDPAQRAVADAAPGVVLVRVRAIAIRRSKFVLAVANGPSAQPPPGRFAKWMPLTRPIASTYPQSCIFATSSRVCSLPSPPRRDIPRVPRESAAPIL